MKREVLIVLLTGSLCISGCAGKGDIPDGVMDVDKEEVSEIEVGITEVAEMESPENSEWQESKEDIIVGEISSEEAIETEELLEEEQEEEELIGEKEDEDGEDGDYDHDTYIYDFTDDEEVTQIEEYPLITSVSEINDLVKSYFSNMADTYIHSKGFTDKTLLVAYVGYKGENLGKVVFVYAVFNPYGERACISIEVEGLGYKEGVVMLTNAAKICSDGNIDNIIAPYKNHPDFQLAEYYNF